jgi:DNA-binding transcriptional LysR family regulator
MIEPTPSCSILGGTLAESFSNIADSVDSIRARATDGVTIGATIAFSSFWLLPRLAEFRQLHPDVHIRVISQDSQYNLADGEVDIIVRYGVPPFSDGTVIASRGDTLFPVCSPEYARTHDLRAFPVGRFDLIDTDFVDRGWYRWADWFARLGRRSEAIEPNFRFSPYTETISAAKASQGVALGWATLIEAFIKDGSLVKVGNEFAVEGRYNIVVPLNSKRSSACQSVIGWLAHALQPAERGISDRT